MEFVDGLNAEKPSDKAPDFIKAKLSIKCRALSEWLSKRPEQWLNLDVRESKKGEYYVCINDFKPGNKSGGDTQAPAGHQPGTSRAPAESEPPPF